jgi:D-lactate dehydrogenase
MRISVFSAKPYDIASLGKANDDRAAPHDLVFLEPHLSAHTAVLAQGSDAICAFVNDSLDAPALAALADQNVRLVLMRCAGFNNVDVAEAERLGIAIGRVPAYSPYAVAEHTIALMLGLNRQLHRAHNRVREGNFTLNGLMGFDLHGKTVGVIGTGRIGICVIRIFKGLGCNILAYDPYPSDEAIAAGAQYAPLAEVLSQSRVVSLHCPLTPQSKHMIDARALAKMQRGAMLVNTSRGALIDTRAVIDALKSGQLGGLALDVYEEEGDLFFENLSGQVLQDDVFARLLTFPNVLITGHQAFFTTEALEAIAQTTLDNADAMAADGAPQYRVTADMVA